jgi:hypothetical protein
MSQSATGQRGLVEDSFEIGVMGTVAEPGLLEKAVNVAS